MHALATLRRSRSLSFFDLALLTGIPARALAEVELGVRRLTAPEREQLALVFGLGSAGLTGAHRRPGAAARPLPQISHAALAALLAATLATTAATADLLPIQAGIALATDDGLRAADDGRRAIAAGQALLDDLLVVGRRAPVVAPPAPAGESEPIAPPLSLVPVPRAAPAATPLFGMSEYGPTGCPVQPAGGAVVLTQGYGVGSHAPAEVWGAVDLAVDGDGDGLAEPGASWYAPVVATHAGVVRVTLDSYPAGNHVWVSQSDGPWRTGYAHLALVTVITGQYVRAGEPIGLIGSTGVSSGPHLDYQVWRGDVNVDPTGLVGCR